MFETLTKYYDTQGISAKSYAKKKLKCEHFEDCSRNKRYFIPAKEAFISIRYEKHEIPRLLVISLDPKPVDYYNDIEHRTLAGVRYHEETAQEERYYNLDSNTHWKKTYDMVFMLMRDFIKSRNRNEVRHFFAHTNSAKCHDKFGSEQASDELFENCSEYLPGEINILDPDIIVTQGAVKYFSFMGSFQQVSGWDLLKKYSDLKKVHPIRVNNHYVIWIEANHPCIHDKSYQVEDYSNFLNYGKLISEFWRSNK